MRESEVRDDHRIAMLRTANLAIAAHQNSSREKPNMLDVISWERFTRDTAYELLSTYARLDEAGRGYIPPSVLKFAAGYTVFRELHAGEEIEVALGGIEGTGYTSEDVHKAFVEAFVKLTDMTEEGVLKQVPDTEALSNLAWPNQVFNLWETEMRQDLIGAGYKLPELTEDGSYGIEEGKTGEYSSDYISPVPDESMIPVNK